MLIDHNPDEWEPISYINTCSYHKKNPDGNWAGCTCSVSYGLRRKVTLKDEFEARDELSDDVWPT